MQVDGKALLSIMAVLDSDSEAAAAAGRPDAGDAASVCGLKLLVYEALSY